MQRLTACLAIRRISARCIASGSGSVERNAGGLPWRVATDSGAARSYTYPSRSVCKLVLLGRTGAVPELREFPDNAQALSFSIATNDVVVRGEERSTTTQWHRVTVSGNVPGFAFLSSVPTGSTVYVEGSMKITPIANDDGSTRQLVNVRVNRNDGIFRVISSPRDTNTAQSRSDEDKKLPF